MTAHVIGDAAVVGAEPLDHVLPAATIGDPGVDHQHVDPGARLGHEVGDSGLARDGEHRRRLSAETAHDGPCSALAGNSAGATLAIPLMGQHAEHHVVDIAIADLLSLAEHALTG